MYFCIAFENKKGTCPLESLRCHKDMNNTPHPTNNRNNNRTAYRDNRTMSRNNNRN